MQYEDHDAVVLLATQPFPVILSANGLRSPDMATSPMTQESSLYSLASVGFTQSNSSITSANQNPPYSYGTQTEYVGVFSDSTPLDELGSPVRTPQPSPRPSPRNPRRIFLNRLDTIDNLDPFLGRQHVAQSIGSSSGDDDEICIAVPQQQHHQPGILCP